jgi:uncharacterized membrane protein
MTDPITRSIIVKARIEDAFAFWADVENFPTFMKHLKSVERIDDKVSRWVMDGPAGTTIQWEAEITTYEPPRRIGWNSRDRSDVKTSGQVLFTDLSHSETEVTVTLKFEPPMGVVGDLGATLVERVDQRLDEDLRRFKHHVEAGTRAGAQIRR